ncbi:phage head spike fiber domain-containing protein [Aquamicrobium defluvii]|uniref:Concanavalin A-like lectin/glucanase superfamily protein n=1 Tax=Aquamicrobium defluvii TaxID=69279 RepID=A0A011TAR7_9HYPH|nr:hypothetical protein [Aquamicrobium defluvii]EXL08729.1 hypothetical protein BG36_03425 [Aquamicrobium defluvii]EZQ14904.1 hypothetical protein CF98_14975 [Halopseudomonas bauzanensis]
MGSVYFQEPSTDGAPGIWELEDALRNQGLGRWPTIPATVPDWIKRGPDDALPVDLADYALGKGWFNGRPYPNLFAYMDAAGGAFSRGSDATYFDASGILRTAGPNVLRLDHDPGAGKALGARLEGGRTNIALRSEDISSSAWQKISGTAPTSYSFRESADTNRHICRQRLAVPDGSFALAFDIRGVGRSNVNVTLETSGAYANRCEVLINLTNGSSTTSNFGTFGGVAVVPEMIDVGLYRVVITGETGAKGGDGAIWISITPAQADGAINYPGEIEKGFDLWRVSLEVAPLASSYIPTGATSATRLADSLTFARAAPPEGTVVIEGRTPLGTGGNQVLWQWDDGTDANRYRLVRVNDGNLRAIMTVAGVDVVNLDLGPVANDADLKVVPSWRAGQFAASLNGAAAVVDTSYTGPLPVVSTVRCGSGATSGDEWYGTMARLGVFDKAYSPAQIKEMSA